MAYLRRAPKVIEDELLNRTRKVNQKFNFPTDKDLKVYLRLKTDGSVFLNKDKSIGMILLSDHDLLQKIYSGIPFSIEEKI